MKDILRDFDLDEKALPPRLALSVISKAKDRRQDPAAFSKHAGKSGDFRMDRIAQLYEEYDKRLHGANALDFDDIILKTVELLETFEDVRTYYQQKFHYIMIDEYQDTNQLQYQLTSLLAGGYENICVVGDDDQSIYKFRGATIENILSFEKQFKGTRVIRLEQNYRSTQAILNAANAVIAHNRGRKGKKLWTENAAGDQITVYEASSETDEANFVTNRIISMSKGKNFKDFAVLYRTNALFERLRSLGVPQAQLNTVCTPIGFDLGGETPEELAIAILAQILLVKNRGRQALTDAKEDKA